MIHALKFVSFKKLDLGKEYLVGFSLDELKYLRRVKLVKVTRKGYNFLDIKTNKCILKRHMYVNKYGQICLLRSFKVSEFEIELVDGDDKIINVNRIL